MLVYRTDSISQRPPCEQPRRYHLQSISSRKYLHGIARVDYDVHLLRDEI